MVKEFQWRSTRRRKSHIPELIFGTLLTSSNYDDDEKKVTGGRNGFGAKVSIYNSPGTFGFFSLLLTIEITAV